MRTYISKCHPSSFVISSSVRLLSSISLLTQRESSFAQTSLRNIFAHAHRKYFLFLKNIGHDHGIRYILLFFHWIPESIWGGNLSYSSENCSWKKFLDLFFTKTNKSMQVCNICYIHLILLFFNKKMVKWIDIQSQKNVIKHEGAKISYREI